jgi:hypothetical protein
MLSDDLRQLTVSALREMGDQSHDGPRVGDTVLVDRAHAVGDGGQGCAPPRTPGRRRSALIYAATLWLHPLAAHRSNFVCARKLAP